MLLMSTDMFSWKNKKNIWIPLLSRAMDNFLYFSEKKKRKKHTSMVNSYANSVDPDQTAPEGLIRVYTVCHLTTYFKKKKCIKSKILAKKVWNKVFEILGHLYSMKLPQHKANLSKK